MLTCVLIGTKHYKPCHVSKKIKKVSYLLNSIRNIIKHIYDSLKVENLSRLKYTDKLTFNRFPSFKRYTRLP